MKKESNMTLARRLFVSSLALAAAWLVGTPVLAQGAPPVGPALPLTQFSLQAQSVFLGTQGIASSGTFSAAGATSNSGPTLGIHGDGLASNVTANNEASASALWALQLVGPANVIVPLVIGGLYSADIDNAFGVSGGLAMGVDRFRLDRIFTFRCQGGDTSGCDASHGNHSQTFTLNVNALSGSETFMLLSLGGSVFGAVPGQLGEFNGMIDPIISIDPTFARASEFTLFFSPDAYGNVAAVPEPESYALLLAGLAVVGALTRRRRR
jgi:PEP-CTERM motif